MFWRVSDVKRAATELTDYRNMIAQIAQTSLREVISATTLNDILSQREAMGREVAGIHRRANRPAGELAKSALKSATSKSRAS